MNGEISHIGCFNRAPGADLRKAFDPWLQSE
jgi:hypothetical protein